MRLRRGSNDQSTKFTITFNVGSGGCSSCHGMAGTSHNRNQCPWVTNKQHVKTEKGMSARARACAGVRCWLTVLSLAINCAGNRPGVSGGRKADGTPALVPGQAVGRLLHGVESDRMYCVWTPMRRTHCFDCVRLFVCSYRKTPKRERTATPKRANIWRNRTAPPNAAHLPLQPVRSIPARSVRLRRTLLRAGSLAKAAPHCTLPPNCHRNPPHPVLRLRTTWRRPRTVHSMRCSPICTPCCAARPLTLRICCPHSLRCTSNPPTSSI